MITLYQRTDCPFCWKVRIALAELGLGYQTVDLELGERHPDVHRLSPTGTVPVMVDDEVVIWESGIMLDYLDRRYGPGRLIPRQAEREAKVRSLHAYSDKIIGGCLKGLVFEKRSKPETEWDPQVIEESEGQWRQCLPRLEQALNGHDFFGEDFGAADAALAARFGVAEVYGVPVTEVYPSLYRWYEATRLRPAWAAAYPTSFIGR